MSRRQLFVPVAYRILLIMAGLGATSITGFSQEAGGTDPDDPVVFDRPPKVKQIRQPEYPRSARAAGIEGVVYLRILVDATGQVGSAQVIRSTAVELEAAAVEAALQWLFEPGEQEGQPVPAVITVPIEFKLNPGGHESIFQTREAEPTDDRPTILQVCQAAIDADRLQEVWHDHENPERVPLVILRNRQLGQFGRTPPGDLEKFGAPVEIAEPEEVGDRPFLEFTWIAIEKDAARVEFDYSPEDVHCTIELAHSHGKWNVDKQKIERGK
ncbi:energy transducer TonB [bacterium]|nr:energy transducer TonB [bacterium]